MRFASSFTDGSVLLRAILAPAEAFRPLLVEAMRTISRAFSARRQHWRAARSYKPGQRTAVDGRDRNPGRRPSNKQEVDMQAHPALVLNADFRPRASELLAAERGFPPNYLHETWLDCLYRDTEIEP
jgi:hypothetical protein